MRRAMMTLAVAAALVVNSHAAKVKIKTDYDKAFKFAGLRTWAWHPEGAGDVKMAVSPDDNPENVRARFEPVIKQSVEQQLASRGLTLAPAGPADLQVVYYLLISTNMSSQVMGQFLPSTTEWGLPPFAGATTSLKVIEQGSLVLDMIDPPTRNLVWRSIAQAEIARQRTDAERAARIRDVLRDMLSKFPPKQ